MRILSKTLLKHSGPYLFKTPETVGSYMLVIRNWDPLGRPSLDPYLNGAFTGLCGRLLAQ